MPIPSRPPHPARLLRRFAFCLVLAAFAGGGALAAGSALRTFDVPAGNASKTLRQFSEQAGVPVVFGTDTASQVSTNAVKGTLPPLEALSQMLANTGLVVTANEKTGALAVSRSPNALRAVAAPDPARPGSQSPSASAMRAAGQNEEAVELSPFHVTADQDVGYLAGNTLAGSRLNTPLKDTAAAISVLTEEFIKDLGATDIAEALEYANNTQLFREDDGAFGSVVNGNGTFSGNNSFRVRGQRATLTRNYFAWSLPTDTYNIERIEESRGPNSILFGIGSAGGVINSSTKQPVAGVSFRRGAVSTDSEGSYRGTVDLNQTALDGKLGLRFNALYGRAETFRLFTYSRQRRAHLAATYRLSDNTRIRAEYEAGNNQAVKAFQWNLLDGGITWHEAGRPTFDTPTANEAAWVRLLPPARRVVYISNLSRIIDTARTGFTQNRSRIITDTSIVDPVVNAGGPGAITRQNFNAVSAYLEHSFGQKTHLSLGYNHQDYSFDGTQPFDSGMVLFGEPNRLLPTGEVNPYAGTYYLEGTTVRWLRAERSDTYRASLATELDFGKWGNYRLAGMAEYEVSKFASGPVIEAWAGAPFNTNAPEAAVNQVRRRNYVTEGVWSTYSLDLPAETGLIRDMVDPISGLTLSSTWVPLNAARNDNPLRQTNVLLGGQARYFGGRLVAGFGFRRDEVDATRRAAMRDPVTKEWVVNWSSQQVQHDTGQTRTLGLVGHVTPAISLLYNQSTNIALASRNQLITPTGLPPEKAEGTGEDMGVAFNLFKGKVYARATYFSTRVERASGIRGFGGPFTTAFDVSNNILGALQDAGSITQAERDAHSYPVGSLSYFDVVSEGYEFSLTANATKNWRLQANYSINDVTDDRIALETGEWRAKEIPYYQSFNQGGLVTSRNNLTIDELIQRFEDAWQQQKAVEGVGSVGNRRYKVSLFTRYTFSSGGLKGLFVGGGYRHQSKMLVGRNDLGGKLYANSNWFADGLVGYQFQKSPLLKRLSLQLNVTNVFDNNQPMVTRLSADSTIVLRQSMQTPRIFRLTANYEL